MLAKLRFASGQWAQLGGFTTLRFFVNYWKRNGFVPALVQAYKRLFWAGGSQYIMLYERWFSRNKLEPQATEANRVYAATRVLIVGPLDLPQCKKYRVLQKLELLAEQGIGATLVHYLDAPQVVQELQMSTQLLLYRVPDGDEVRGYLREARRLGVAVGYDIDDPVFDREVYEQNPNLQFLQPSESKHLLRSCDQYLAVLRQVDYMVVSTVGMETVARKHFSGPILQWPNVLDGETLAILEHDGGQVLPDRGTTVVISYMSGSRAHEQDFRVVADALAGIMQRYPQVELLIGGYLELPQCLSPYEQRIGRFPFLGYQGYFARLRQADINIVPLVDNTFNACKSTIRYLEASAVKVPCVATAVGDFAEQIEDGVTGFLARDTAQWQAALGTLIEEPERRASMAEAAFQQVMGEQTVFHLQQRLAGELDRLFAVASGREG